MAEDADSDIAIRFVDENDYKKISTKPVSAKWKLNQNLTKPIFRLQNTRICLQKCESYRAAKFTSMTHDLEGCIIN